MHPILKEIEAELKHASEELAHRFALCCIEDIANQLEDPAVIKAYGQYKAAVTVFDDASKPSLQALGVELQRLAQSHPGSTSIDGTRHAAVSATYALAHAAQGHAVQAAAYAAYSHLYGYAGYAVQDPALFSEVHRQQLAQLLLLKSAHPPQGAST